MLNRNNIGSRIPSGGRFSLGVRGKKRSLTGTKGGTNAQATPKAIPYKGPHVSLKDAMAKMPSFGVRAPGAMPGSNLKHGQKYWDESQGRWRTAYNAPPPGIGSSKRATVGGKPDKVRKTTGKPRVPGSTTGLGLPGGPGGGGGVNPSPAVNIFDSVYMAQRADADRQLAMDSLEPEGLLKKLAAKNSAGQTMYDSLMGTLQQRFKSAAYGNNAALAQRGIFNSGARDVYARDAAQGFEQERFGLRDQYGDLAADRAKNQLEAAKQSHAGVLAALAQGAGERKSEQDAGFDFGGPAQIAGPSRYVPRGWKPGESGFFMQNGKYHFVNKSGQIANNVKKPGKGVRIY